MPQLLKRCFMLENGADGMGLEQMQQQPQQQMQQPAARDADASMPNPFTANVSMALGMMNPQFANRRTTIRMVVPDCAVSTIIGKKGTGIGIGIGIGIGTGTGRPGVLAR